MRYLQTSLPIILNLSPLTIMYRLTLVVSYWVNLDQLTEVATHGVEMLWTK